MRCQTVALLLTLTPLVLALLVLVSVFAALR